LLCHGFPLPVPAYLGIAAVWHRFATFLGFTLSSLQHIGPRGTAVPLRSQRCTQRLSWLPATGRRVELWSATRAMAETLPKASRYAVLYI
jgi:hypothetical protein